MLKDLGFLYKSCNCIYLCLLVFNISLTIKSQHNNQYTCDRTTSKNALKKDFFSSVVFVTIHPSIFFNRFFLSCSLRSWCLSPAVIVWDAWYTLDQSQVHHNIMCLAHNAYVWLSAVVWEFFPFTAWGGSFIKLLAKITKIMQINTNLCQSPFYTHYIMFKFIGNDDSLLRLGTEW